MTAKATVNKTEQKNEARKTVEIIVPRRDIRMLWALIVKAEKLDSEARISTQFIEDYATEVWRSEHADAGRLMVYESSHVSAAVMMYRDAENAISVRGEVLRLRVSNGNHWSEYDLLEPLNKGRASAGIDSIDVIDPINRGCEHSEKEHIELMVFEALTVHGKGEIQ